MGEPAMPPGEPLRLLLDLLPSLAIFIIVMGSVAWAGTRYDAAPFQASHGWRQR